MSSAADVVGHRRSRTVLLVADLIVVVATLPWIARQVEVPWGWMAVWFVGFVGMTAASATRPFDPAVRRYGPITMIVMILALVAMTGGATSPYAALYLPLVGFLAAFRDTRTFVTGLVLATVAEIAVATVDGDVASVGASVVVAAAAALTFVLVHRVACDYRDANQTYRSVLEHHAGPTYQLSAEDGTFRSANAAALRVLGMPLEDLLGRPSPDVVAPGEAERLMPIFVAAREGQPQELTVRTDAPGGRYHLRGTIFPVRARGKIGAVMGITWDVTEDTEAAFGAAALRGVVDRLLTPVAIYDAETHRTLYSNDAARHFSSRPDDASSPLPWSQVRQEIVADLPGVDETRTVRLQGRTDADPDWEVTVHCLRGPRNLLAFTAVDTSERARRERGLQALLASEQEAAERLRSIDVMKNSFLSATSHELRTPLTVILGTAITFTQRRHELTPDQRRQLEASLLNQAQHLDQLLEDLLDVDRLVRGVTQSQPSSFDVAATVRRLSRSIMEHSRLTVQAPDHLMSFADRIQIERIITNLLDNTAKYAPEADVDVTLIPLPDDGFQLQVTDTGPGIPNDQLEQVFEPFHRGHLDHPQPGTGIGLALVAEFAAAHGGRAYAQSPPTGGTRIVVQIPDRRSTREQA